MFDSAARVITGLSSGSPLSSRLEKSTPSLLLVRFKLSVYILLVVGIETEILAGFEEIGADS